MSDERVAINFTFNTVGFVAAVDRLAWVLYRGSAARSAYRAKTRRRNRR